MTHRALELLVTSLAVVVLAAPLEASVTWEKVPGAPEAWYVDLATDGSDLAAAIMMSGHSYNTGFPGFALRTESGWELLPLPAPGSIPIARPVTAVALSASRLAAAGYSSCGDVPNVTGFQIWLWDRAGRQWTTLPEAPPTSWNCEGVVGLEFDGDKLLALTSLCRLLRWTGSAWETPEGWPTTPLTSGGCWRPFIHDSGRLFAAAGAIFEYRQGKIEYPSQPEGPERIGVAVLPEGLAYLLEPGTSYYSNGVLLPGQSEPFSTPNFTMSPLFNFQGSLYLGSLTGPVRLSEGRWSYTRPSGPFGWSEARPWGPEGPFVEVRGALYAASRFGLYAGRPAIRRLLPVVIRGTGRAGESYLTDLYLSNFGATNVTAQIELRPPEGVAGSTWGADVELAAGTGKRMEDVISLFQAMPGAPASGSLVIHFDGAVQDEDVWAGADVVSAKAGRHMRTFVPAVPWGSGPGYYIENSVGPVPRVDATVRTNVGWTDAGDSGPAGPLATPFLLGFLEGRNPFQFFTSPGQWEQSLLTNILPDLQEGIVLRLSGPAYWGGPNCCWGNESISPRDLVSYAVEVDQESGDGSMTLFETLSLDTDRSILFFPAVVRAEGRDGVHWSSELRLGRSQERPGGVTVQLAFRGEIGGDRRSVTWPLSLRTGESVRLDLAAEVLRQAGVLDNGRSVIGTLLVSPDLLPSRAIYGEIRVAGRRDGIPGTFSVAMPGVPAGRWAAQRAIVPGLSHDATLRSNLAVANAAPDDTGALTLRVELYRADTGVLVGSDEATLGPGERRQWNDVGVTLGSLQGGGDLYAIVSRISGHGSFIAYGVVHDRASGDGAFRPMTAVE